ncbi:cell surface protein (plasmid) [Collimonas arenae]|uniref:Cell surface protein n=1 Tax=Collimonas arenae TaxID=279058 RepID=A0A0A1FHY5_9BURK|nr:YadA-like family protein [Collimonas arenae]AIY44186.1 cell surface protein [Collimonas arenae]
MATTIICSKKAVIKKKFPYGKTALSAALFIAFSVPSMHEANAGTLLCEGPSAVMQNGGTLPGLTGGQTGTWTAYTGNTDIPLPANLGFVLDATPSSTCPTGTTNAGYAATTSELTTLIQSSANPSTVTYNNGGTTANPGTVTVAPGVNGTDAVNVNQLNTVSTAVTNLSTSVSSLSTSQTALSSTVSTLSTSVSGLSTSQTALGQSVASSLGGGSSYNPATGAITQPSYTVNGSTYNDVGSALGAVSTLAANSVQYDDPSHSAITLGGVGSTTPVSLHNVAAGVAGTDAVNVNQLNAAGANTLNQANTYTDLKTKYFQANSTGAASSATGTDAVAIGPGTVVAGNSAIAGGLNATASADQTVVFGANSVGSAVGAVAVGATSAASGVGAVAVGDNSTAAAANTVAVGQLSKASSAGAVAIGFNAQATGDPTVAIGANSLAQGNNSVALGAGAQATQANSVALGAGSTTAATIATTGTTINGTAYKFAGTVPLGTVSVGSVGSERTVTNVAAGQVNATSTDAVNGSQLNATNQSVNALGSNVNALGTSVAGNLGGGATYNPATGAVTAPSYTINGVTYNSVGGAIGAVGSSIAANNTSGLPNPVASGANSVAIGPGSVSDRSNTVSVGSAGAERAIANVAAGTYSTDATNLGQVTGMVNSGVSQADAYTDSKLGQFSQQVTKQMNAVGAASMAASSLIPNARAEGNFQLAAAMGTYAGATAVAVGANYWASDRFLINAHFSHATSGGKMATSIGATLGF